MVRNVITLVSAIFFALSIHASASPLKTRASNQLSERNFSCDTDHVQCCDQIMNKADAAKSFGNLLDLPSGLAGNVGLGCSVRPRCEDSFRFD